MKIQGAKLIHIKVKLGKIISNTGVKSHTKISKIETGFGLMREIEQTREEGRRN